MLVACGLELNLVTHSRTGVIRLKARVVVEFEISRAQLAFEHRARRSRAQYLSVNRRGGQDVQISLVPLHLPVEQHSPVNAHAISKGVDFLLGGASQ